MSAKFTDFTVQLNILHNEEFNPTQDVDKEFRKFLRRMEKRGYHIDGRLSRTTSEEITSTFIQ